MKKRTYGLLLKKLSTKNLKIPSPHPHGLSDGATKNLNLLQLCIIIVNEISIKKPPTFTGKREK